MKTVSTLLPTFFFLISCGLFENVGISQESAQSANQSFANRIARRENTQLKYGVFRDRIEFLQVGITEDFQKNFLLPRKGESVSQAMTRYYRETRHELKVVESKLNTLLIDSEVGRKDIEKTIVRDLKKVLTKSEVSALWQMEFFVNGSINYLERRDNREELAVSASDIVKLKSKHREALRLHEERTNNGKIRLVKNVLAQLKSNQLGSLNKLFGVNLNRFDQLYVQYDWYEFVQVARVDVPSQEWGASIPNDYELTKDYSPLRIKHLFPYLEFEGGPLRKPETDLVERLDVLKQRCKVATFDPDKRISFRGKETFEILESIQTALGELGELSSAQKTLQKEIFVPLIKARHAEIPILVNRNKKILTSLLPHQKEACRDAILVRYGPIRFVLSDYSCEKLEIDQVQRAKILNCAKNEWDKFISTTQESRALAMKTMLETLSPESQSKLEKRLGVSLEKLCKTYSLMPYGSFAKECQKKRLK